MGVVNFYNYLFEEIVDPRTKDWPFVHSPVPLIMIIFCYCFIIYVAGPKYMKNREAYSFKTFMKLYNLFQIIANALLVYGTLTSGWFTDFGLGCVPVDLLPDGKPYHLAKMAYWTYMMKLIDLIETVMYVLRKKNRQISVLHVYHHISTAAVAWIITKWVPGGMLTSIILINNSVHVMMYTYYLLSTGGPMLQNLVRPFKPWITITQMIQFWIIMLHISQGLSPSCNISKFPCALVIVDLMINFILFCNFYQQNYRRKKVM